MTEFKVGGCYTQSPEGDSAAQKPTILVTGFDPEYSRVGAFTGVDSFGQRAWLQDTPRERRMYRQSTTPEFMKHLRANAARRGLPV